MSDQTARDVAVAAYTSTGRSERDYVRSMLMPGFYDWMATSGVDLTDDDMWRVVDEVQKLQLGHGTPVAEALPGIIDGIKGIADQAHGAAE